MRDKVRKKKHRCQVCGTYGVTHIHHIFGGRWRPRSEAHDFVIELCPFCHAKAHGDARFSRDLKHDCQLEWLETHTLDEWMELMGKSWIDEQELTALKVKRGPRSGADIFDD